MAAIAFDTLKAARRMIEAGMPQRQAEAQAEVMAEAFVFNVESLVTNDYLEACLDARFLLQDAKFEQRFTGLEAKIEKRFTGLEAKVDLGISEANGKFNLIYWMLAVVIASTTVPALHGLILG